MKNKSRSLLFQDRLVITPSSTAAVTVNPSPYTSPLYSVALTLAKKLLETCLPALYCLDFAINGVLTTSR